MIRELVNGIRGRKKLVDKSLSLEGVLNLLQRLMPSIKIDLFYNREKNRFNLAKHNPTSVAAFLESVFNESTSELSSNRYQLYVGRKSCKAYIDLKDSHQKASLSYLI